MYVLTLGHLPVGEEDGEEDKDEHEEEEGDGADHAVAAHGHRLHEHAGVQEPGQRQPVQYSVQTISTHRYVYVEYKNTVFRFTSILDTSGETQLKLCQGHAFIYVFSKHCSNGTKCVSERIQYLPYLG